MNPYKSLAIAAAISAMGIAGLAHVGDSVEPVREKPRPRKPAPNDTGPVTGTTRESKRAKRRRLARGTEESQP